MKTETIEILADGEVERLLAEKVSAADGNQTRAAETLGLTQTLLNKTFSGRYKVGPSVLHALGLEKRAVVVVKKSPTPFQRY